MSIIDRAFIEEAPLLEELTFRSKEHWGYSETVLENWRRGYAGPPTQAFLDGRVMALRQQEGDSIVGYYALAEMKDAEVGLTHLFVEPDKIGYGYGHELFERAIDQAQKIGGITLKIVSDPGAALFYERHGAKHLGVVTYPNNPGYTSPILTLDLSRNIQK